MINKQIASRLPVRRARVITFAVLTLVWLSVVLPSGLNAVGKWQQSSRNYSVSHVVFTVASYVSWHDRYIPMKNIGDTSFLKGDYAKAAQEYELAASITPEEKMCELRFNWAMALTRKADAMQYTDPVFALTNYLEAKRVMSYGSCSSGGSDSEDQEQQQEQQSSDGGQDQDSSQSQDPQSGDSGQDQGQSQDQNQDQQRPGGDQAQGEQSGNGSGGQSDSQKFKQLNDYVDKKIKEAEDRANAGDQKQQNAQNKGEQESDDAGSSDDSLGDNSEEVRQQRQLNRDTKSSQQRGNGSGGQTEDDYRLVY